MPTFTFTSPDGKNYDVNGPDGSTKEQAFQVLQAQLGQGQQPASQAQQPKAPPPPGVIQRIFDAGYKGSRFGPTGMMIGAGNELYNTVQGGLDTAGYAAGQKVTDVASGLGASPEVAGGLGAVANTAISQGPSMLAGGELAKAAAPTMENMARSVMRSALKPTLSANQTGKAAIAVDTMLDKGLNVTKGGLDSLRTEIGGLNKQVKDILQSSRATVDISGVDDAFLKLKKGVLNQASWRDDLASVQKSLTEFLDNPQLQGLQKEIVPSNVSIDGVLSPKVPVQLAQDLKSGTQKSIADAYGTKGTAWEESQKAIARVLRSAIEKVAPEVQPLNAEQSKLIATLSVAERRDMVAANKNPLGLALLAKSPHAIAAFVADRSELFKSLLARMLYSGSEQIPANAARLGAGAVGAARQAQQ